jgi:hypothetical protein
VVGYVDIVDLVLLGAWVVPLIIGVVKLRRRTGGVALTIIGAIWALGAVGLAAAGHVGVSRFSAALRVENFNPARLSRQPMRVNRFDAPPRVEDFNSDTFKGQTGTVTLPYRGESSLIVTDTDAHKRLRLHVRDGVAQAPVGDYKVSSYDISMKGKGGVTWTASHYASSSQALEVSAPSPAHLNLGPPFTAQVEVNESSGEGTMLQLSITGRAGESYVIISRQWRAKPPRFQVLDRLGQVVWQGQFEYG